MGKILLHNLEDINFFAFDGDKFDVEFLQCLTHFVKEASEDNVFLPEQFAGRMEDVELP